MAAKIILKRSSQIGASGIPAPTSLEYGELALNYATGILYYRKPDNTLGSITTGTGGGGGGGGATTTRNVQTFTATAGQTLFTVSGGYLIGYIDIYLNGILLDSSDYVATNGINVQLAIGAEINDIVTIISYQVLSVSTNTTTRTVTDYTATNGQTIFTVSGGYEPGYIDVYLNGILLAASDYVSSSGSDIQLLSPAVANDIVTIAKYNVLNISNISVPDLTDVLISNLQTNQILKWNGTRWVNSTLAASGSGITLTDLAATTATGINYNNTTGIFSLSSIPNTSLTNNSITINGTAVQLGGTRLISLAELNTVNITNPSTGQVLKFNGTQWINSTDNVGSGGGGSVTLSSFSVIDGGGDGALSYSDITGQFTYTGPSAAEVRAHFSAGTGITILNGQISATGATTLTGLSDVTVGSALNNQVLAYDSGTSKWINKRPSFNENSEIVTNSLAYAFNDIYRPSSEHVQKYYVVSANGTISYMFSGYTNQGNPYVAVTPGSWVAFVLRPLAGSHPFVIRKAGANITTGLRHYDDNRDLTTSVNTGAQGKTGGILFWLVPDDIHTGQYTYHCTAHAGMNGSFIRAEVAAWRGTINSTAYIRYNDTNWELTNNGSTYGRIITTADSGIITNSMLAGSITTDKINLASANIIVGSGLNMGSGVTLSGDATISNTGVLTIANNSVTVAKLSATGTASAQTFLRGDGVWGSAESTPPSILGSAYKTATRDYGSGVARGINKTSSGTTISSLTLAQSVNTGPGGDLGLTITDLTGSRLIVLPFQPTNANTYIYWANINRLSGTDPIGSFTAVIGTSDAPPYLEGRSWAIHPSNKTMWVAYSNQNNNRAILSITGTNVLDLATSTTLYGSVLFDTFNTSVLPFPAFDTRVGCTLVMHPSGKYLYYVMSDSQIQVYSITFLSGYNLTAISTGSCSNVTQLIMDPQGKYLWAINSNSLLTVFTINESTGAITAGATTYNFVGQGQLVTSGTKSLINYTIHPTGCYLYANGIADFTNNQFIDKFNIDRSTGLPSFTTGDSIALPNSSQPRDFSITLDGRRAFTLQGTDEERLREYIINDDGSLLYAGAAALTNLYDSLPTSNSLTYNSIGFDPQGTFLFASNTNNLRAYYIKTHTQGVTNISGSLSVGGPTYLNGSAIEIATVNSSAAPTGTINVDVFKQSIVYYTVNASGNWTINVRGTSSLSLNNLMSIGQSLTVVFLAQQGTTAYNVSAFQVDGINQTVKWQGGTAPSAGNANSLDVRTYTIIKTASATYTVLASLTKYA